MPHSGPLCPSCSARTRRSCPFRDGTRRRPCAGTTRERSRRPPWIPSSPPDHALTSAELRREGAAHERLAIRFGWAREPSRRRPHEARSGPSKARRPLPFPAFGFSAFDGAGGIGRRRSRDPDPVGGHRPRADDAWLRAGFALRDEAVVRRTRGDVRDAAAADGRVRQIATEARAICSPTRKLTRPGNQRHRPARDRRAGGLLPRGLQPRRRERGVRRRRWPPSCCARFRYARAHESSVPLGRAAIRGRLGSRRAPGDEPTDFMIERGSGREHRENERGGGYQLPVLRR